ncbi:hypothetical protein WN51_09823 [Melipona quadrifasciata]|uniref:Uncharacterized protein n=1 Tax=Melipona quadrifasciata TaxID=166423 RepID=A0A0M9A7K8_9HYME|nr:hypothetical protein WN51_09823 [Melipona quadrifasciata]
MIKYIPHDKYGTRMTKTSKFLKNGTTCDTLSEKNDIDVKSMSPSVCYKIQQGTNESNFPPQHQSDIYISRRAIKRNYASPCT